MESLVESLNYDFNIQLHQFKKCSSERLSGREKRLAVAWVEKLKSEWNSLEEARLRNDLLYSLVRCAEAGCLRPPFNQKPPNGRLLNLKSVLPADLRAQVDNARPQPQSKPEIFERSPDKGAFLAAQPVPRSGAFCYLAIVSREPNCQ